MRSAFLALFCLLPTLVVASQVDPIALVNAQLPEGFNIAKYRTEQLRGLMDEQMVDDVAAENFVVHDFDQDGIDDILVVIEAHPTLRNKSKNTPCANYAPESHCTFVFGKRALQFYKGLGSDRFSLVFSNDKAVQPATDSGDSFKGVKLLASGAIEINFSGGTFAAWDETFMFKYEDDGFYEQEEMIKSCFVAKEQCVIERTDLLNQVLFQEARHKTRVIRRSSEKLEFIMARTSLAEFEANEQ